MLLLTDTAPRVHHHFWKLLPADAAEAEARRLLAGEHEDIDRGSWPEAGAPQRGHRRDRADDPQRPVIRPRQGDCVGM